MEDTSEPAISAAGVHEKVVKEDIHLKVKSMDKEPNDEKGAEVKAKSVEKEKPKEKEQHKEKDKEKSEKNKKKDVDEGGGEEKER